MTGMKELKEKVHRKVYDNLHTESVTDDIGLQEMLGVGEIEDSLIDPTHDFWDDYEKEISAMQDSKHELQFAILSLRDDGEIAILEPFGEGAERVFVKVKEPNYGSGTDRPYPEFGDCPECGDPFVNLDFGVKTFYGKVYLVTKLDCAGACDEQEYEQLLHPKK